MYRHCMQSVVICFHFTIFVVLETTTAKAPSILPELWFAFILLSLSYWKQLQYILQRKKPVVICFHFTIFVVLETTLRRVRMGPVALWFAFILLSLSYWKQPMRAFLLLGNSCDLLSFYYLCRTGNNSFRLSKQPLEVVICFHFTIFVVLETTQFKKSSPTPSLWFAFILLSLSYWKQLWIKKYETILGCDLLSFYYLCRTGNNGRSPRWRLPSVVICFHFTIFVVLETTGSGNHRECFGCDLLSFYYLCRTGNNVPRIRQGTSIVVICFHFTIFVVLETTHPRTTCGRIRLWFAFILLSLSYWKQLQLVTMWCLHVVICFHFTIFVVLETTPQ